jgi:hypothetical protein
MAPKKLTVLCMMASSISLPALAQTTITVHPTNNTRSVYIANLGYGGGRVGLTVDTAIYKFNGTNCVKVAGVESDTRFSKIRANDCIFYMSFMQNGIEYTSAFMSANDFVKLSQAFYPSTVVTIYFYNSAKGYQLDSQTAPVLARQVAAQNQSPPVTYQAQPTYQARSSQSSQSASSPAQDQASLNRAIESIIQSDARGWWMHKFDAGSVTGANIRAASADGSVQIARAYYTYSGGTRDWIDVKVSNGQLVCVEYGGELSSCRSVYDPNKSASYAGAIAAAVVLAVVVAAASSSGRSSNSGAGGSSNSGSPNQRNTDDYRPPRPNATVSSNSGSPKEDTSIGCAWGDRAYGTCH